MIKKIFRRLLIIAFFPVLLAGCVSSQSQKLENDAQSSVAPVTCIAILPADSSFNVSDTITGEQKKHLQHGVDVMNRLLAQELSGKDKIKFISHDQISGLRLTGSENPVEVARLAGERIHCSTVLQTSVVRYSDRIGTKWSVESPASVAFDLRLIDTRTGNLLWAAKFDEEQVPVLDNLYNFSKAKTRGFTWIKADELMKEGMQEKISSSPYFRQLLQGKKQEKATNSLEDKI